VKAKPLFLAVVALALAACGSSSLAIPKTKPASSRFVVVPNPHVDGADRSPEEMFAALRAVGLRVSMKGNWTDSCVSFDYVARLSPAPGTHVHRGAKVTLTPEGIGYASRVYASAKPRRSRTPSFIGRPVSAALRWANDRGVCWWIPNAPPLDGSSAHDLYSAYRVTAQRPAPGAVLTDRGRWWALTVTPRR